MSTPVTREEEEVMEWEKERKDTLTLGRSAVTGY
jgi:hypothetical protein